MVLLTIVVHSLAKRTQLIGDGPEYLLMVRALSTHASADIRAEDVDFFLALPDTTLNRIKIQKEKFIKLSLELRNPSPDNKWINQLGLFVGHEQKVYSCHFWLYSLLAIPFYWLGLFLGLGHVAGFTLFHLALIAAMLVSIIRLMPHNKWLAAVAFLCCGVSFYLTWTGPEILTAVCVLGACMQTLRAQPGTALLLAGLGATHNPPLIVLFPFILFYTLLSKRWPFLIWPDTPVQKIWPKQILMASAALVLAALPYLFFWIKFGVPSIIGLYFTDFNLITPNRLHSLFFDLNQGMIVGVPGLLLVWVISLVWSLALTKNRRGYLLPTGLMLLILLVMACFTLPATNWNAGCRAMIRYSFWLTMPIFTLLLHYLIISEARSGRLFLITLITIQMALMFDIGELGQRYNYLHHNRLASWVLKHHPTWYNPEAEIMMERVLGIDGAFLSHRIVAYPQSGLPAKILRHWSDWDSHAGFCPDGFYLSGHQVRPAGGGWEYLHPPFTCTAIPQLMQSGFWHFAKKYPGHQHLLGKGWSNQEKEGVWTNGYLAELHVPVPNGLHPKSIRFSGRYSGSQRYSQVTINGKNLGRHSLVNHNVAIPESLRSARELIITLKHPNAISPLSLGESNDRRLLGFFLTTLKLE